MLTALDELEKALRITQNKMNRPPVFGGGDILPGNHQLIQEALYHYQPGVDSSEYSVV